MVWDAMKAVIRGKIMVISSTYRKEKQQYKNDILQCIKHLEDQYKRMCSKMSCKKLLIEEEGEGHRSMADA